MHIKEELGERRFPSFAFLQEGSRSRRTGDSAEDQVKIGLRRRRDVRRSRSVESIRAAASSHLAPTSQSTARRILVSDAPNGKSPEFGFHPPAQDSMTLGTTQQLTDEIQLHHRSSHSNSRHLKTHRRCLKSSGLETFFHPA